MKPLFTLIITLAIVNLCFSQTTYNFTGNGKWTVITNWANNLRPPSTLPAGYTINISPSQGNSCILDTVQVISQGANLNISLGVNFIINGGVIINGSNPSTIPSIFICNQEWTLKNLDVSKYLNGDPIPQVNNFNTWSHLTTGAWRYENDDSLNNTSFGKLYNWYAATDPRGLAPIGWHIPSDVEWVTLIDCLGGQPSAANKMKSTNLWFPPDATATNSSGFTGLPGGYCSSIVNGFQPIGHATGWWSITANISSTAWKYELFNGDDLVNRSYVNKGYGFYLRCVKN